MENLSKMTIDDSSTSMYFSFNSTATNKTADAMESVAEMSSTIDQEDAEENITLEADKKYDPDIQVQTVKKLSFSVSPVKAIPKNILKTYKAFSSTPTKAQLLRSVEITRGSAAAEVCGLGMAFLEDPQEYINAVVSEDKENQVLECQDTYSETSSEIVISVIEKTQEEVKPIGKKVGFSNLSVLKGSSNSNLRQSENRPSVQRCDSDVYSNRPSKMVHKRMSRITKDTNHEDKEFTVNDVSKVKNLILKISKEVPANRKLRANLEKPFNLMGKATRMSIVKTTLNSPARKASRKSITSAQVVNKNLQGVAHKRKSFNPGVDGATQKNILPVGTRKSMLPTFATGPKLRTVSSTFIPTGRKSISQPYTSATVIPPNACVKSTGLKEEFVCEVCCRKFRVLSLFEAHKRSHSTAFPSNKTNNSGNDNQCRYCDKKFAISKALVNHLIQNCIKIPPGDKRKIMFPTAPPSQTLSQFHHKMPPKSTSNFSSSGSLSSNKTHKIHSQLGGNSEIGDNSMPPPSTNKNRKTLPHSGVYCTPNKDIQCHVCKMSFTNILAYTEHSLSHSTVSKNNGFVLYNE